MLGLTTTSFACSLQLIQKRSYRYIFFNDFLPGKSFSLLFSISMPPSGRRAPKGQGGSALSIRNRRNIRRRCLRLVESEPLLTNAPSDPFGLVAIIHDQHAFASSSTCSKFLANLKRRRLYTLPPA